MPARTAPPDVTPAPAQRRTRPVVYSTSDGQPMAETDTHRDLMVYFIEALKAFFAREGRRAYVAGNNFLFWEEGNPKSRVSPDCYVVFEIGPEPRDSFKSWEEGDRLPAVVFEFTSRKTRSNDVKKKRPLYEGVLRVPEYFQFDPTGDYLRPRLQGFRLDETGSYKPIPLQEDRLSSEQLGLELVQEGEWLRLYDPARGAFLPTPQEQAARMEEQASEIKRLRAQLAALGADRGER